MRPLLLLFLLISAPLSAQVVTQNFKLDQVGYRCNARKVMVISQPQTGYNAPSAFTPGPTLSVRRLADNSIVFTGSPVAWNSGSTHTQSGDKAWWFDFSLVTTPDDYYIHDATNNCNSHPFRIADDVYNDALKHALRAFYFQRCGTPKSSTHTGNFWSDNTPCHVGNLQDTDCRDVTDPNNTALALDLSGGWHDAGDYNKYVNFTASAVHYLLDAYEQNAPAFGDDNDIPESGNGIPDILDEIKWELDWLLKMQKSDGSVLMKVSVQGFPAGSPPSTDVAQRLYGESASSSTRTACGIFAHAAIVFGSSSDPNLQTFAATLLSKAQLAWTWLQNNPGHSNYANTNFNSANPEVSAYTQDALSLVAAVYLYAATGNTSYRTYVDNNYANIQPMQWWYWYPFESVHQNALLYYTTTTGATTATVNAIRANCSNSVSSNNADLLPAWSSQADPYMAYMKDQDYVWNNNQFKSETGAIYTNMLRYNVDPANQTNYRDAGEGYVHYLHGANAHGLCFLSNADTFGADNPIKEIYHSWFGDGTVFDYDHNPLGFASYIGPPPGYMTCGVNYYYTPDGAYTGPPISPPQNQPVQKSYKDWNTSWPENSWEIAEVGIYTNASYVKLLSYYADTAAITTSVPAQKANADIRLFPNPAQENFTVLAEQGEQFVVQLYDLSGRIMLSQQFTSRGNIDVSKFAPAIYTCVIQTESGKQKTEKLVVLKRN